MKQKLETTKIQFKHRKTKKLCHLPKVSTKSVFFVRYVMRVSFDTTKHTYLRNTYKYTHILLLLFPLFIQKKIHVVVFHSPTFFRLHVITPFKRYQF